MLRIIGAGMAGLLTAQMLRRQEPGVLEAQPSLPDNHNALLRFRSDVVSRVTGIPFRKVWVTKAIKVGQCLIATPTLREQNMYSYKVTGGVRARSILNVEPGERYIAPPTFLADLAQGLTITYGHAVSHVHQGDCPTISTIPMPVLMELVKWNAPQFPYQPVWSVTAWLTECEVDVFQTIYYPDPCEERYYRASITGNRLVVEYAYDATLLAADEVASDLMNVLSDFGLGDLINPYTLQPVIRHHKYGKLSPIDETERRAFILAMTDQYQIYSIGRFATWRQLLLDDVVNDIHMVNRFLTDRSTYERHLFYRTEPKR